MTGSEVAKPQPVVSENNKAAVGCLFVLGLSGGRILSLDPDGSDLRVIVMGCRHPDGIVVDVESGFIYWPTWVSLI
jgi:hypothetical protein